MADFSQHHRLLPGMRPRPEVVLVDKQHSKDDIKSESNATFLFLKNCSNYELNLEGKAAKVMCESCNNLSLIVGDPLVSGMIEVYKCKTVTISLAGSCQIPIFQIDDSDDIRIKVSEKTCVKSIYFQRSNGIQVINCGSGEGEFLIDSSVQSEPAGIDDIPQWVAHWNDSHTAFVTEKLKRAGIYPLAEQREATNTP